MGNVRRPLGCGCVKRVRRGQSTILGSYGTSYALLVTVIISLGAFATAGAVTIVTRSQWQASPATHHLDPLKRPAPYVIILHTASKSCSSEDQCKRLVRNIQDAHIRHNGWSDIGYSFLVGGDGKVYEGRGWDSVGAFAHGYNVKAIGIAFIGNFNEVLPPKEAIEAAKQLIAEGVKLGKISKDYKLLGHRQVSKTESPGELLYKNIQTWGHWSPKP